MPAQQSDLLLAISEGVQTLLAKQDSDEAIAINKGIQEALTKIRGSK